MSVGNNLFFSFPVTSDFFSSEIESLTNSTTMYSLISPSLSSFSTYPRFWMVEIVGAYVDGLPIPSSSSFLTKEAST